MSSHFKGPLLGSHMAGDGLFRDMPLAVVDRVRVRYQTWLELFNEEMAAGQLILNGAHVDDQNTATAPDQIITSETACLIINAGTKANSGSSIVFDIAPTAAALGNAFNTPRAITSTTTLMDNRELIWAARIGITTDQADGSYDGGIMLGWNTIDATPIVSATTLLPSLATGGGAGFHIGPTGLVSFYSSTAAITTAGTSTGVTLNTTDGFAVGASGTFVSGDGQSAWHEFGFRIKWLDASSGTGRIDYYIDNRLIGTKVNTGLPMASSEGYSSNIVVCNGAGTLVDVGVDYMLTAITKAGYTNTTLLP